MDLYKKFRPITSTPFKQSCCYTEYEPCEALKPYIRCFWGTTAPVEQFADETLVIPDTCVDIIFRANYSDNSISSGFCGIDDRTFISKSAEGKNVFTFGIRFYAWGASFFTEDALRNTKNSFFDAEEHFSRLKKEIEPYLFDFSDIYKAILKAETVLLKNINENRKNDYVIEAVGKILENNGNMQISRLSKEIHISDRQLERVFGEYIGCSAKSLVSLVRYQYLWNDIIFNSGFDVMEAVLKYGYSDQSHLLNDFRKYHSMSISQAKIHALTHALNNVGFLQDNAERV